MSLTRKEISTIIFTNLTSNKEVLKAQFLKSKATIGYFFIDNLLPEELVLEIYQKFPSTDVSVKRKNLREYKFTAFQMDKYDSLLEEVIYAFQDEKIIKIVSEICDLESTFGDEHLYAGGLSLMGKDNFLKPHLDNSHDKDINRWRVLNLLYYVSPEWELENGGNLELWPNGLKKTPLTIVSKFNRLVVMATHNNSWHSVSKVNTDTIRCCVSNYYFSEKPLLHTDSFHVTTFRAYPKEKIRDAFLMIDNFLRSSIRKVLKKGVKKSSHQYKK